MRDDYMERKRAEERQRYDLICKYIEEGKDVSVADRRFAMFYRTCVLKKGEK